MLLAASLGIAPAQEPSLDLKQFDTATIKPALAKDGSWGMHFTATGFIGRGVNLSVLLDEAYGFNWRSGRVSIPKNWTDRLFDVDARMDGEHQALFAKMSEPDRQKLLRQLLKDRFKLTLVEETKELDSFLLQVDKGGPRLGPVLIETDEEKARLSLITKSRPGLLGVARMSMESLARVLEGTVGRMVFDRTNLPGRYAFALHWTPEGVESAEWPDLATALQEQLGLRLVAAKVPVQVVVVSRVEEPSEN